MYTFSPVISQNCHRCRFSTNCHGGHKITDLLMKNSLRPNYAAGNELSHRGLSFQETRDSKSSSQCEESCGNVSDDETCLSVSLRLFYVTWENKELWKEQNCGFFFFFQISYLDEHIFYYGRWQFSGKIKKGVEISFSQKMQMNRCTCL